jgi:hypothetical protein
MTNNNFPQDFIDEIYEIGDRDSWDFAYLVSHVCYGRTDNEYLGKTDMQALGDVFKLIHFFVVSGDFEIIKTVPSPYGSIKGVSYWANLDLAMIPYPKDLASFKKEMIEVYEKEGLRADLFIEDIWLHKKAIGKKAPEVPPEIAKIFEPVA